MFTNSLLRIPHQTILLTTCVCTAAVTAAEWRYSSQFVDFTYSFTVTSEALEKAPKWDAKHENPPLSPRKALQIAQERFNRLYTPDDHKTWAVSSPELSLHQLRPNHWVWMVSYTATPTDVMLLDTPPWLDLVVLMDGTVLPKESTGEPSRYAMSQFEKKENAIDKQPGEPIGNANEFIEIESDFVTFRTMVPHPKRLTTVVSEKRLLQSPDWPPNNDYPPLPAARVIELAETEMAKIVGMAVPSDWSVKCASASLNNAHELKWYWVVRFEAQSIRGGSTGQRPFLDVAVLMDGSVAPLLEKDNCE